MTVHFGMSEPKTWRY